MTTQTLTLTDFLLARIAEDEAAVIDRGECRCDGEFDASQRPDCADRIAIECEAKRKIIALHHAPKPWAPDHDPSCSSQDYAETSADCETLHALALSHADHPDFRDEWRP